MTTDSPQPEPAEANQQPAPVSRWSRLAGSRRVWGIAAVLAVGLGGVLAWSLFWPGPTNEVTLESALAAYEQGEVTKAREIARQFADDLRVQPPYRGTAPFLLGAILFDQAAGYLNPKDRQTLYQLAARHLETAHERGFPPGYEIRGAYL